MEVDFGRKQTCFQIQALWLVYCIALRKELNFSEPVCHLWNNGDRNLPIELSWGLAMLLVKPRAPCLTHHNFNKCWLLLLPRFLLSLSPPFWIGKHKWSWPLELPQLLVCYHRLPEINGIFSPIRLLAFFSQGPFLLLFTKYCVPIMCETPARPFTYSLSLCCMCSSM